MPHPRPRRVALATAGLALTGALVLAAPLAASAHVHVEPDAADPGAASVDLVFTVPNESPTASTTSVQIALPASACFAVVRPAAVRGWRVTVGTGAARTVRFDATGDGIGDRQVQSFGLRVGPVPAVGSVPIPVTQTYSDGTVVRWDQRTPASGDEPEHPAPTLYVQDDPPPDHDGDGDGDGDEGVAAHADRTAAPDATVATVLAGSALAVAVLGVVVAVLALLRTRRR